VPIHNVLAVTTSDKALAVGPTPNRARYRVRPTASAYIAISRERSSLCFLLLLFCSFSPLHFYPSAPLPFPCSPPNRECRRGCPCRPAALGGGRIVCTPASAGTAVRFYVLRHWNQAHPIVGHQAARSGWANACMSPRKAVGYRANAIRKAGSSAGSIDRDGQCRSMILSRATLRCPIQAMTDFATPDSVCLHRATTGLRAVKWIRNSPSLFPT
jgi:hypothetical protein